MTDSEYSHFTLLRDLIRLSADLFSPDSPITIARAPGRLDVMGGIADYSGSVVLEATLAEAAWVALQLRDDGELRIRSIPVESLHVGNAPPFDFATDSSRLGIERGGSLTQAAEFFASRLKDRWAAYLAGCWPVLMSARPDADLSRGASLLLASEVPLGAGVSSSAAIEVATMRALAAAYSLEMEGMELARLCQTVENRIAGAPCGIMDQVTSALGQKGSLLALRCQPHELLGYRAVPKGFAIAGLDSGVKHSVGGSSYANARIAAFMGHRILAAKAGGDFMNGYLANLPPERYRSEFGDLLPERMTGKAFLDGYGATVDPITTVQPDQTYAVRSCAEHPIFENDRVLRFLDLFRAADESPEGERAALMAEAGRLMRASHESYGKNCDMGSEETDFLVHETERIGADRGLYGAKITGGGCGGTTAILMRDDPTASAALEEVRSAYAMRYGFAPRLFRGDSPGAMDWPPVLLDRI